MAYFRKRTNGWEYRISYKTPDGKFKQKSKSGFRTKSEAVRAASEAELNLEKYTHIDKDITFADYFFKWYTIHRIQNVRIGTIKNYEAAHLVIQKYFKNTKIAAITPSEYQEVLNKMGESYRKGTLRTINSKIKACAKYAVMDGIINVNFAELAKVYSTVPQKREDEKFLTMAEYHSLINLTKNNGREHRDLQLYVLAVTGMRIGESVGLTWEDIDFEKGEIQINKTWNIYTNDGFAKTKNKQSIRTVPIDDITIRLLKEFKENSWKPNRFNRIFSSTAQSYLNKRLKYLVGRSVHVHSLRHTYVSFLLANGIEVLTISKLIGHKDPTITLNTYSHLLQEKEIEDFQRIKTIFRSNLGQNPSKSL